MLPLEPDPETLQAITLACVELVRAHLGTLGEQPAMDLDGVAELLSRVRHPVPEQGRALAEVLGLFGAAVGKSFNTAGPGYLAFIPGGGLPVAALGDYLALSTNRFVGMQGTAPVLTAIEAQTVSWLAGLMGYPEGAGGLLTTGGSLSNLIALVTARVNRLGEEFLDGTLYFSVETHQSMVKAARFAGLPAARLRRIPTDGRLRMDPAALARAVDEDRARGLRPFMVVANFGTTNTGAIDPIDAILEVARRHRMWVHADAAYGGFFRLADDGPRRLAGIERCDSITLDPHKGLFLPYGTGCLLVRDPEHLRRAHASEAVYLQDAAGGGDSVKTTPASPRVKEEHSSFEIPSYNDLSPELSREFRGLRLWLPLMLHGLEAFRAALTEKLSLARMVYERLSRNPRFELVDEPQLSVVAFRLRGASDDDNAQLLRRVNAGRRVFLSSTRIDGRYTLRLCVLSFRTHQDRVEEALRALEAEQEGK